MMDDQANDMERVLRHAFNPGHGVVDLEEARAAARAMFSMVRVRVSGPPDEYYKLFGVGVEPIELE